MSVQSIIDNTKDNLAELTYFTEENSKDFPNHEEVFKKAMNNLPNKYNNDASGDTEKQREFKQTGLNDFLMYVPDQCPTEFPNYEQTD